MEEKDGVYERNFLIRRLMRETKWKTAQFKHLQRNTRNDNASRFGKKENKKIVAIVNFFQTKLRH